MALYLGYSGIHGNVRAQQERYPDVTPRLSGLAQGKDAAAALVSDTTILAVAAEERFTGDKATGQFPINAIRYCLDVAGADLTDVDHIFHSFDYNMSAGLEQADPDLAARYHSMYSVEAQRRLLREYFPEVVRLPELSGVRHHLAHAHSAFDVSGFDRAVVLVSDGMGEEASLTLYEAHDGKYWKLAAVPAGHSLGLLYALVTYHLGFVPGMDEYKVMALAAMGDPNRYSGQFGELVVPQEGGLYLIPFLCREIGRRAQDLHSAALRTLAEAFGPARQPDEDLAGHHADIAAALQKVLNDAVLRVAKVAKRLSNADNISVAGGVALNCVANSHLADSAMFGQIFIQPAAGDDGSALGAALSGASGRRGWQGGAMREPYWGPGFSDAVLKDVALRNAHLGDVRILGEAQIGESAAKDIEAGLVIGWFEGRMEFGPRALGNRSILADPRFARTRDRVNSAIKNREMFRPLAPAVAAEEASRYFEIEASEADRYRHMLFTARIRPEYRERLVAVCHTDGSARLQTVRRADNPRFYAVLEGLRRMIGMPVVLNTSLNVQGQPIVRTPEEAVDTACRAGLDCLYLGPARLHIEAR